MPIVANDIQIRLSGGAANSNPDASIGGAKSSVAAGTNLFDNVNSTEATGGDTEYRCFYVHNAHASLTLSTAKIYISNPNGPGGVYAGDTITVGVGTSAVNGQEQGPLADEGTAPSGVTFYPAATSADALALGDIPFGQHKAVWVKREIAAGATAFSNAGFSLTVFGDTAA